MTVTQYGNREYLVNNWTSPLNGGITDSATSLTVDDGSALPSGLEEYRVKIDSEILRIRGRSSNTLTIIERGAEGTSAAAHSDNADVTAYLTAAGLQRFLLDHRGTPFTEESTSRSGPLCRMLDQDHNVLTSSSFSWVNQGTATASDSSDGGLIMRVPVETGWNLRILTLSLPTTPYRVRSRIWIGPGVTQLGTSGCAAGIGWRQSSSGRLVVGFGRPGQAIGMWRMTSPTAYSATVDTIHYVHQNRIWMELEDDGTSFHVKFSDDGNNWNRDGTQWWEESRTAWLTTTGPDQIVLWGFGGSGTNNWAPAIKFDNLIIDEE